MIEGFSHLGQQFRHARGPELADPVGDSRQCGTLGIADVHVLIDGHLRTQSMSYVIDPARPAV